MTIKRSKATLVTCKNYIQKYRQNYPKEPKKKVTRGVRKDKQHKNIDRMNRCNMTKLKLKAINYMENCPINKAEWRKKKTRKVAENEPNAPNLYVTSAKCTFGGKLPQTSFFLGVLCLFRPELILTMMSGGSLP